MNIKFHYILYSISQSNAHLETYPPQFKLQIQDAFYSSFLF